MLAGPHERLQRHPSIGFAVARHGVGEPQRCALAIRVQRAGLVPHEGPQRIHRQLGFTPEMTAALDAPTAATALSGELCHEHMKARIEIGAGVVITRERGVCGNTRAPPGGSALVSRRLTTARQSRVTIESIW